MKSRSSSSAFTLIELLVVIVVIAVLAALIFPAISGGMARAKNAKCSSFMRQLGIAAMAYAGDHEMTLPATVHQRRAGLKSWTITLQEYAGGTIVYRCPCDEDPVRPYTYVINDFLTPNPAGAPDLDFSRLVRLERRSATMLFAEASAAYANSDHFHFADFHVSGVPFGIFEEQVAIRRHVDAANYVFTDGHMESLTWQQAQQRLSEDGSRFVDPTAELTH